MSIKKNLNISNSPSHRQRKEDTRRRLAPTVQVLGNSRPVTAAVIFKNLRGATLLSTLGVRHPKFAVNFVRSRNAASDLKNLATLPSQVVSAMFPLSNNNLTAFGWKSYLASEVVSQSADLTPEMRTRLIYDLLPNARFELSAGESDTPVNWAARVVSSLGKVNVLDKNRVTQFKKVAPAKLAAPVVSGICAQGHGVSNKEQKVRRSLFDGVSWTMSTGSPLKLRPFDNKTSAVSLAALRGAAKKVDMTAVRTLTAPLKVLKKYFKPKKVSKTLFAPVRSAVKSVFHRPQRARRVVDTRSRKGIFIDFLVYGAGVKRIRSSKVVRAFKADIAGLYSAPARPSSRVNKILKAHRRKNIVRSDAFTPFSLFGGAALARLKAKASGRFNKTTRSPKRAKKRFIKNSRLVRRTANNTSPLRQIMLNVPLTASEAGMSVTSVLPRLPTRGVIFGSKREALNANIVEFSFGLANAGKIQVRRTRVHPVVVPSPVTALSLAACIKPAVKSYNRLGLGGVKLGAPHMSHFGAHLQAFFGGKGGYGQPLGISATAPRMIAALLRRRLFNPMFHRHLGLDPFRRATRAANARRFYREERHFASLLTWNPAIRATHAKRFGLVNKFPRDVVNIFQHIVRRRATRIRLRKGINRIRKTLRRKRRLFRRRRKPGTWVTGFTRFRLRQRRLNRFKRFGYRRSRAPGFLFAHQASFRRTRKTRLHFFKTAQYFKRRYRDYVRRDERRGGYNDVYYRRHARVRNFYGVQVGAFGAGLSIRLRPMSSRTSKRRGVRNHKFRRQLKRFHYLSRSKRNRRKWRAKGVQLYQARRTFKCMRRNVVLRKLRRVQGKLNVLRARTALSIVEPKTTANALVNQTKAAVVAGIVTKTRHSGVKVSRSLFLRRVLKMQFWKTTAQVLKTFGDGSGFARVPVSVTNLAQKLYNLPLQRRILQGKRKLARERAERKRVLALMNRNRRPTRKRRAKNKLSPAQKAAQLRAYQRRARAKAAQKRAWGLPLFRIKRRRRSLVKKKRKAVVRSALGKRKRAARKVRRPRRKFSIYRFVRSRRSRRKRRIRNALVSPRHNLRMSAMRFKRLATLRAAQPSNAAAAGVAVLRGVVGSFDFAPMLVKHTRNAQCALSNWRVSLRLAFARSRATAVRSTFDVGGSGNTSTPLGSLVNNKLRRSLANLAGTAVRARTLRCFNFFETKRVAARYVVRAFDRRAPVRQAAVSRILNSAAKLDKLLVALNNPRGVDEPLDLVKAAELVVRYSTTTRNIFPAGASDGSVAWFKSLPKHTDMAVNVGTGRRASFMPMVLLEESFIR